MKPSEYLDALRIELNLPSDYALQKELGVTKAAISKYRNNKAHFDDAVCRRVGALLRKHPGIVMLDMQRQRAKEPEDRAMWNIILEKFSTGFNPLLLLPNPRQDWTLTR